MANPASQSEKSVAETLRLDLVEKIGALESAVESGDYRSMSNATRDFISRAPIVVFRAPEIFNDALNDRVLKLFKRAYETAEDTEEANFKTNIGYRLVIFDSYVKNGVWKVEDISYEEYGLDRSSQVDGG